MAFGFYRALTIDHTKVSTSDQTNFPVFVSLANNSLRTTTWGGNVQNANGYDIGFYSDSGLTTKLDWEIEHYVASTGELRAWVRVPTLTHSSDYVIYMAYGDATISTFQGNVNGTWNSNYKMVHHFDSTGPQPSRSASNPIINYGGGGWKDSQVYDPTVMVDPADSSKLIMNFSGMAAPVQSGIQSIGRATSTIAQPATWTEYGSNPILQRGTGGQWDNVSNGIRHDSTIWNTDDNLFYLYYTADNGSSGSSCGLATSSDGITFTKYASNPVLVPSGAETHVSQMAVYKDGSNWYVLYSYRTAGGTLQGYRYASSSDGKAWTKSGGDVIAVGAAGSYDSTFMEFHQLTKIGSVYYCNYECYNGTTWTIATAKATTVNGTWTKSVNNPIFQKSAIVGSFDEFHVATPCITAISGVYWLFYCGSNGATYGTSNWAMAVASLDSFAPIDLYTAAASVTADSTSNANDLTAASSPGVQWYGEVGSAADVSAGGALVSSFYKGNGYFTTPLADVSYTAGTVEWWLYPLFTPPDGNGYAFWGQLASDEFSAQRFTDGSVYIGWRASGVDGRVIVATTNPNMTQAVWQHYALVWTSGAHATLYRNGVLMGTASSNTTVSNLATAFAIGRQGSGNVTGCNGYEDEFRLSNSARSVDWLLTAYNSQSSPSTFFSVGSETPFSGGGGVPLIWFAGT